MWISHPTSTLCILGALVERQLTVMCGFIFILFHWSICPIPYCFDYCSFVIYFATERCDVSSFLILPQDLVIHRGFVVLRIIKLFFNLSVKGVSIFIGSTLNL